MSPKSSSKGFTLTELLVVVAIITLLSMLAVTALGSAKKRTDEANKPNCDKYAEYNVDNVPARCARHFGL